MKKLVWGIGLITQMVWAAQSVSPLQTRDVQLKILTDPQEMTVYVFDRDEPGISHCVNGCEVVWPPILSPTETLSAPLSVITRPDGSHQIAFRGSPLYRYDGDSAAGEMFGDGIQNQWHVARP